AVDVRVDRRAAAAAGLSDQQIGQAVATALRGAPAGTIMVDGTPQNVVLRTGAGPADVAALRGLPLGVTSLGAVRLGDVATVREVEQAASITRIDGSRSASITATPSADDLGRVSTDLQQRLDDLALPAGATAEIGGVSAEQEEAFGELGLALALAVAIVYLVMVATFCSLLQPLLQLVSIPFAATGALGLLLITDTPLGVPALIGMLMLIGIVVTNAIVLIDLVNQYRSAGASVRNAVIDGARRRLRPILMTAVATICALFPMSLGLSGGGLFISQPLAVVVIGGLISSTLLTLVLVPVLYSLVERARARLTGKRLPGLDSTPVPADPPLAVAAPAASPPAAPSVTGLVTNGTGTPLPGAVLTLVGAGGSQVGQATAAGDGRYRITAPDSGSYLLICRAPSGEHEPQASWVSLGNPPTTHDIRFTGSAAGSRR
ncbi:MAG TPA: efflux RND transporter permease subunit, partial [Pseudonocardiaceae bacterium]|nr:efflux RND transporter permease subunit [Pseudonocardiaceae bacterium]